MEQNRQTDKKSYSQLFKLNLSQLPLIENKYHKIKKICFPQSLGSIPDLFPLLSMIFHIYQILDFPLYLQFPWNPFYFYIYDMPEILERPFNINILFILDIPHNLEIHDILNI